MALFATCFRWYFPRISQIGWKHQDKDIFLRKISNQSNALSAEKPSLDFPYGRFLTSKTSASTGANIYIDLSNKSSAYFTSLNKKYNFEAYLSDKFRGMQKGTRKRLSMYIKRAWYSRQLRCESTWRKTTYSRRN